MCKLRTEYFFLSSSRFLPEALLSRRTLAMPEKKKKKDKPNGRAQEVAYSRPLG